MVKKGDEKTQSNTTADLFPGDLSSSNFQDIWNWLNQSHAERLLCRVVPDDQGRSFAFRVSSAYRRIEKIVAVMRSDLKLQPGSRVLLYGVPDEDLFLILHAGWIAGIVPVVVPNATRPEKLAGLCNEMSVQAVFFPMNCSAQVASLYHSLQSVNSWVLCGSSSSGPTVPGLKKLEELVANAFFDSKQEKARISPDQDALIVVRPDGKRIVASVFSQSALLLAAEVSATLHPTVDYSLPQDEREKRLHWCLLPPSSLPGLVHNYILPLLTASPSLIRGATDAIKFWQQLHADKVRFVIIPFDLMNTLVRRGKTATFMAPESELSVLLYSDRRIPMGILERFEQQFGVSINPCYSLTEAGGVVFGFPYEHFHGQSQSRPWYTDYSIPASGIALPGVEWKVSNIVGDPVESEEAGSLRLRTTRMMSGYVVGFEGQCKVLNEGYLKTSDEAFFLNATQKGSSAVKLCITGRTSDFIERDGSRVNIRHIENVLMAIRGVRRAVVVAFDNEFVGKEIGAYVWLINSANLKDYEVLALARRDLKYDESPKVVIIARPGGGGAGEELSSTLDLRDLFEPYTRSDYRRRSS